MRTLGSLTISNKEKEFYFEPLKPIKSIVYFGEQFDNFNNSNVSKFFETNFVWIIKSKHITK